MKRNVHGAIDAGFRALFWRYEKAVLMTNRKIEQRAADYTYQEACEDCDRLDQMRSQVINEIKRSAVAEKTASDRDSIDI